MFVFFGSIIPWDQFIPRDVTPNCGAWQFILFLALVLLFRRIPIVLAMKRFIPDVRTYREALFCGHFGSTGVGALFLAMEALAQLETGKSLPLEQQPKPIPPYSKEIRAIHLIWPVICFVVRGSTMVHGLSVVLISVSGHFIRNKGERAPLLAAETERLDGTVHEGGGGESEPEVSGSDED
jgi:NhaP-type Na+/H+ or K+/H+ antiporter